MITNIVLNLNIRNICTNDPVKYKEVSTRGAYDHAFKLGYTIHARLHLDYEDDFNTNSSALSMERRAESKSVNEVYSFHDTS